ncbi:MAG: acyltransferase family protein [Geminicoccaceae bacterium]
MFPLLAVPVLLRQRSGAAVLLATSLTLYMVLETIKGSLHIYADFAVLRCLAGFFVGLALYNLGADNRIMGGAGAGLAQIIAVVGIVAAVHLPGPDGAVIPFFALLIFACRFDQGWLPRLLSAPVLVWLGTISYSLYLTHHFVWKFSRNVLVRLPVVGPHLRDGDLQWLLPFLAMGAILTVAALAYYGIEKPGRRLVHRILDQAGKGRAGAVQTA